MIDVTLILSMVASLAAAQLTLGTVSRSPGQSASLSSVLVTGGLRMSGLQWDLVYDNSNLTITATEGAAATAAGKTFQATPLVNGLRILIIGFNPTWIGDGVLADLSIRLAANATPGKYSLVFTDVTATDINANIVLLGTTDGSVTIVAPPTVSAPSALPVGTANVAFPSTAVTAEGGNSPYTWSATGLPNGMSIAAATGIISGTPASGTGTPINVQVTVTDSNSATANRSYTLTVNAALAIFGPASLPPGIVGAPYPATAATATGGAAPYLWTATGLPDGLSIAAGTGIISGIPATGNGSPFSVRVWVVDSNLTKSGRGYTLVVNSKLSISGPAFLSVGMVNAPYPLTTVTATGGSGVYTWSATGLPGGMSIGSATGILGGTPANGTGSPLLVRIQVLDSTSATANCSFALTINALPLTIDAPSALPSGIVDVAYPATRISAHGGLGNYTWSATGLPPGLGLDGSATITGMPATAAGSPFSVQITVTDDTSTPVSRSYSLTINPAVTNLPVTSGVSNAAGGQVVVAPNGWVSVYGSNFVTEGTIDDWSKSIAGGKLPTTLDGISVTVAGQSAYVSFVSPAQINVLLPDVGFGPVPVTVNTPAGTSTPFIVDSQHYSPAFFPLPNNQPAATHLDYTLAARDGTYQGTPTVPAKPGEVIILWCAGFGPTNPPAPTGVPVPATPTYNTASPVTVTIGGVPALVYGTALASGFAGLYQLVVTMPDSLPDGDYKLIASINGAQTPAVTFTLHN